MATDQSNGNSGGSSDEEIDVKTKVSASPEPAEMQAARGARALTEQEDLSVGDKTTQLPFDGGFGGISENTMDVDADELENMRVNTEQIAITSDRASTVASHLRTRLETSVGSKSKGRTGRTVPPPVPPTADNNDDNVGDITAVTDLHGATNLDASDILGQRLEEDAMKAASDKIADEVGLSMDSAEIPVTVNFVSVPLSPKEEAEKQEALATNPLATSRATTPEKEAKPAAAINLEEDGGESLADLVRQVRYRPPTRLAAVGSSIVLILVAGLWATGDEQAKASATNDDPIEERAPEAVAIRTVDKTATPEVEPTLGEPDPAITAALDEEREAAAAEARRLAREKAELEALADDPDVPAEETEPAVEGGEETPAESADNVPTDPGGEVPAEETTTDPEEEPADELPEPEIVIDPDSVPEISINETPTKPPVDNKRKPSRKQQRAAAQALYKQASTSFMQGKLAASEKGFKAALKADPSLATAHRGLGLVYERRGSKSRAASSLRRYLKQAPRAKDAAAIRARIARIGK